MIELLANAVKDDSHWLSTMLFESPGFLIAGLAVVWAVLRVGGRRSGNTKMLRVSWLALLMIAALFATSALVVTKREAVSKAMDDLLLAVEYKDIPAFRARVLPDATAQVFGMTHTRERMEKIIDGATINDLKATSSSTLIRDDSAALVALIRADGEVAGMPGIQISRWLFEWKYVDGQWRVSLMVCEEMGPGALDW